jgi:hypothetical protein
MKDLSSYVWCVPALKSAARPAGPQEASLIRGHRMRLHAYHPSLSKGSGRSVQ